MKPTILTSAILLLAGYVTAFPAWNEDATLAPLYQSPESEPIKDSYIVVLKDHVDTSNVQSHCHWVGNLLKRDLTATDYLDPVAADGITHTYDTPGMKGYAGKFSESVLDHIRRSPEVAYVERDSMVYTNELERGAPWGLARISNRKRLTFATFSKYNYKENGGKGVKVYVIDTGINVDHEDFQGRAEWGTTFADDGDEDGNGHGSHCAGTIAGAKYGVAKLAEPVAVKVLSSQGSGSNKWVIAGIQYAIDSHETDAAKGNKNFKGSVANMSLGGGKSRALDAMVNAAVDSGITFAVAAGNDNADACKYSPAAAESAITVGASTLADERAYFSNYGKCVDVFAPGLNIKSTWTGSKYATNVISGTSMASPHVAGLAAYFISFEESVVVPKTIKDKILRLATPGVLTSIPSDTPNLLIYNNYQEDNNGYQGYI
ncbi:serine protease [Apophysomyces sp. BC1034]|nr:serine protease [Apophysomyces sp. BC1015]KAG0180522.1 serine protease [Apophysomyces sp. BC1021]KAG0190998.1 serine protease [Apophysomyces sp. BC1034]